MLSDDDMVKILAKMLLLVFALGLFFAITFGVWGEPLEQLFNQQKCVFWFGRIKPWAWAVGIGLLLSDILLPIPATGIMAALGSVYGVWLGTLISATGSVAAGFAGYGLARLAGRPVTRFLASEEELLRFQKLFDGWGGAAIIISRWLPVLPEVMSILAGMAKMSHQRFFAALLMGTVPACFLYAYLGHISRNLPGYGMAIAIAAPLVLWPVFLKCIPRRYHGAAAPLDP